MEVNSIIAKNLSVPSMRIHGEKYETVNKDISKIVEETSRHEEKAVKKFDPEIAKESLMDLKDVQNFLYMMIGAEIEIKQDNVITGRQADYVA